MEIEGLNALTAVGLVAAAGLGAGLSPCALPALIMLTGRLSSRQTTSRFRTVGLAIAFAAGTATALAFLGLLAGLAGKALFQLNIMRYVVVVLLVVAGLKMMGLICLHIKGPHLLNVRAGGAFETFLLGIPLALFTCPCTASLIFSLLCYCAGKAGALYGAVLMFVFGVARTLPLLVMSIGTGIAVSGQRFDKFRRSIAKAAGLAAIITALYFIAAW